SRKPPPPTGALLTASAVTIRLSPPAPINADKKPQPPTERDHEEGLEEQVRRVGHNTAVSTTRSPSANRPGRSGRRSKVRQLPRGTSSATARPAAGGGITPVPPTPAP